ncbi:hypothetical protein F971_01519 [Acinetobacter vivianii]|uniref:Uncharacterized protein n=1 Tax=Acinetobacter vivianii TaxID=1776742 RepID=N8UY94_9GAMM|nr:hypothetical protein F971_01519 [Acinetobacter vivianii]
MLRELLADVRERREVEAWLGTKHEAPAGSQTKSMD